MKNKPMKSLLIIAFAILLSSNTSPLKALDVKTLKSFPLNSLDGIITKENVQLDKKVSSDKKGALKVTVTKPTTIKLFEVSGISIDNAKLIYQAKLKTQGISGKVYLEMWCCFKDKGEFFSRGLNDTATGNTNWTTKETQFFLKKDEKPDKIKLNLVIDGKGTTWIDDIKLLQTPLK